ncbi:unnamed protein product [Mytilus edulis]|uniref:Uncharacterized protein n=1 Tax=Mytilus edulis TaxID=6550 RepID=A0A8S3RD20_MYTED|nr:unnamed protein product [Mytilus edulis]
MSNSSNFDGTVPFRWSLLKADIESTAFVKGWNSEKNCKHWSYTVQANYETVCKLFNDRFDSVGNPLLIRENLENIFPYPDELLDEFTDRIEELVEGAFQNESENVKEHLIIEYLTNTCCDEEGKELVQAVAEGSVYEAKRYLCTLSKFTSKRYLKLKSLWEPKMTNRIDDIDFKIEKTGDHDHIVRRQETDEIVDSKDITRTINNDEPECYTQPKHSSEVECNGAMEKKDADTNLIEKTEVHSPVMIEQGTEQTAHQGKTIEKVSDPVIEHHATSCHSNVVKEDAVYTIECPNTNYEAYWLGEDDYKMHREESSTLKCETDCLGENDDDKIQTEESHSSNYKSDAICETEEKGQKKLTKSHCFNEQKHDCNNKMNKSKVSAAKPCKETSRLITRHKLHLLVQAMVKDNNDLDKKRSTNRKEHILEENINTNEDSQYILKYDQVMQSQPKHEEGGNKDIRHFIKLNSYQNQLTQSELELLSNTIGRLTPNSVYCQNNLLTLELKDKQYRYWMTRKHDGENRERDSNKEGNNFEDTLNNCVKRQILKKEQWAQTDDLSSEKESSLTKRKEVKDQSIQTSVDKQTPMHFDQEHEWNMHFTQTAINHRNTVKAEDEHINPGFLEGTQLTGKTRTEKLQEAKRCSRAYENNNIGRDCLKDTEKKAYVKTKTSKFKQIKKEQQIKKIKHKLITNKKESDTSKRNMMSTIKRKDELVARRMLPKTMSWGKDGKLRWKRPKAKRFHSKTLGRSDWNLNLDRIDVQTESLVTDKQFDISAIEDGDIVAIQN